MMESMGYKPGQGLGRAETGITTPISQSSQLGRRGFGYSAGGLEKEDVKWEEEEVNIHQKVEWLQTPAQPVPNKVELDSWMVEGERKTTIAHETHFFDPTTLKAILENKSMFDNLSTKEFLNSRQRSNPYETIKGAFFQNRAAMKMANIDAITGFMFTDPRTENGAPLGPLEVLYFADICAGPGGFSEYVLWRKKWHAKGFGFTLKDPADGSDFKLDAFTSPCETFDPHYGVGGYNGDGDITRPDNQSEFRNYVIENTEGKGVHFVMADGGISVEGEENKQELLLKQLVLCQYATSLSILRPGGSCVVKIFDMFTLFSIGLFYLLYRCFHRIALFKPVTSRPANSERYVLCQGLRAGSESVADYMYNINIALTQLSGSDRDVLEVVPLSLMEQDETFSTYITAFNDSFGLHQVTHLQKVQYFVKNSALQDNRQADIRRRCLHLWKIPDTPRTIHTSHEKADHIFSEQWQRLYSPKSNAEGKARMAADVPCLRSDRFPTVTREGLDFLHSLHSWKWCWACGKRMMLVGLGRNQVFGWEMRGDRPDFSLRRDLSDLELPRGTVLEVELVQELQGEGSGQRKTNVVYIVDVLAIYNEFFGRKPLKERLRYAEKLAKVLNKPCRKSTPLLRAKPHRRVAELCSDDTFPKLEMKQCKGKSWKVPTIAVANSQSRFLAPVGMIFFKAIKDPWHLHIGRKGFYYFSAADKTSTYECPPGSVASFLDVLKSRHLWMWERGIIPGLCGEEEEKEAGGLTRRALSSTLRQFMTHP
jgi:cap1 methyltransferase